MEYQQTMLRFVHREPTCEDMITIIATMTIITIVTITTIVTIFTIFTTVTIITSASGCKAVPCRASCLKSKVWAPKQLV